MTRKLTTITMAALFGCGLTAPCPKLSVRCSPEVCLVSQNFSGCKSPYMYDWVSAVKAELNDKYYLNVEGPVNFESVWSSWDGWTYKAEFTNWNGK